MIGSLPVTLFECHKPGKHLDFAELLTTTVTNKHMPWK